MSQENVEIVKRANAALNAGDFEGVLRFYGEEAELRDLQSAPDQPLAVSGIEAIRHVWASWAAAFDGLSADVDEFIDAGQTVIAAVRWHGEGKESGVSIDNHQFDRYEFQDGRIIRAVLGYRSRTEALEAAGLSE
jgi:ketosteroid isomerase-like protein